MTRFEPSPDALTTLKDTVVVLTGGATGIGAATVHLLHHAGAHVVFGDVNRHAAESLVASLSTSTSSPPPVFVPCDVTHYADNLSLFKTALQTFGRVDHAIAIAGLGERPGWFEAGLTPPSVDVEPDTAVLDVNLKGVLFFARIACAYLKAAAGPPRDRSLTLLSSVAGFEESPGLFVYQASKHGVLGLMRALRLYAPAAFGVRVNAVCPWMTRTGMVAGIERAWRDAGLPTNAPGDVAAVLAGLMAAGPGSADGILRAQVGEGESWRGAKGVLNSSACDWGDVRGGINGRAVYVEGGRAWEIEEGLASTQPLWLGRGPCARLIQGQRLLGQDGDWTK